MTLTVDKDTVNIGDTVTVVISNADVTATGVGLYLEFDKNLLECTKIYGVDDDEYLGMYYSGRKGAATWIDATVGDTVESTNSDGIFSFGIMQTKDTLYFEGVIATLTFTAKASGEVTFVLNEDTAGTDAFRGVAATQTLTIKGNEPVHECTAGAVSYEKGTNGKHTKIVACADNCGENFSVTEETCSGGTADCEHAAVCEFCGNTYGEAKGHGKTNGFRYVHVAGSDTHNVVCLDCQKTVEEGVACTFEEGIHVCKFACGNETACADGNNDHKCDVCGNELSKCDDKGNDGDHDCDVCGKPGITQCADGNSDHNCDDCGEPLSECSDNDDHFCDICGDPMGECDDKENDGDHNCDVCGKPGITECAGGNATCLAKPVCDECDQEYGEKDSENHVGEQTTICTDNGEDHTVTVTCECGGQISTETVSHLYGEGFECVCGHVLSGWQNKQDDWYYVVDGKPVTGIVRVPYPTVEINGVTYAPNADDLAYAQTNADSKYTDAETAVFVFGADGKFQQITGIVDGNRYAVNGMIGWHVGLVEVDGEYYYFVGDVNGGGNIAAEGDTYLTRINGIDGFESKDIYNFEGGKFSGLNGLVDRYGDGVLYYYENSKLMVGNGLTKIGDQYVYVRSTNGQIVVGTKWWVAKTNDDNILPGLYTFDENGYLQSAKDPNVNGLEEGIYYKNGMPYYAGLIEINGDIYYINSAGEAVTGTYYITKLDNYTGSLEFNRGDKLTFGADGKLIIE